MFKQTILFLLLSTICFSCVNDDSIEDEEALYFFKGNLNGENAEINLQGSDVTDYSWGHDVSQDFFDCVIDYESEINGDVPLAFVLTLTSVYNGECSEESSHFESIFETGSFPFATDIINSNVKAVKCSVNLDGVYYRSENGDQNNASFSITNVSFENNDLGQFQVVEGNISCTLYNSSNSSDFVELTNGTFKMSFTTYN